MAAGPRIAADAPLARPARVGLVASAEAATDDLGNRWENSFEFDPEACVDSETRDPCDSDTVITVPANVADQVVEPFEVITTYRCTALAGPPRDWQARLARRHAANFEQEVSFEFWTGTLAQASGWTAQLFLADPAADDLTEGGPQTPLNGLQCLQQYLADTNGGQRGFIHATRSTITAWRAAGNQITREGPLLVDLYDNIIVPGAGYDGSDPDGNAASDGDVWAYATGPVALRRSGLRTPSDDEAIEGIDRTDNTFTAYGSETVAVYWDGCAHAAVRMDVPVCNTGGS